MWKKKLMQEIQKANNKTNRKTKQTMEALSSFGLGHKVLELVCIHFTLVHAIDYNIQYLYYIFSISYNIFFVSVSFESEHTLSHSLGRFSYV